jgi:hypothetical protein
MPFLQIQMTTLRIALALSLAAPLFTACLTPVQLYQVPQPPKLLSSATDVAAATKVEHDEYKKTTSFTGANASQYNTLLIRGWRDDKTKTARFQIYADSFYAGQWRFYNDAYDSDGNRLEFTSIDRKVVSCRGGCTYTETVGLTVSRKYLEEHQETGIRFKVSGKAGEFTAELPAAYVKGFISSVDVAS